jgi:Uma2 family endonuclease
MVMAATATEVTRPLRRVEYDKLVALGVFENERVELIEGELVTMSPIGAPHNFSVQALTELLVLALHGRAWVRPQMSFAAHELSEPEPDLAIVPRADYHVEQPAQALTVIEVAESSLAYDRGRKLRLYANCGVPEYWVVNIPQRCVEVYREPQPNGYARCDRYEPGQSIRLASFNDVVLSVADFLK